MTQDSFCLKALSFPGKERVQGIVAAGHPITARVGRTILERGGNAVDAIVAASITACVTEPMLTSLAGGGYLLIHNGSDETIIDGMCHMPAKTLEQPEKIVVDFGGAQQPFWIGRGSVAPPGHLAALLVAHRLYGRLAWQNVVEPAIGLARQGVELAPFQAYVVKLLTDIVLHSKEARRFFAPQGKPLEAGELYRNEAFAAFLQKLADDPDPDILREPYETMGIPYETVEPRVRAPLTSSFREYIVLTNSLPNPAGLLIAYTLQQLEKRIYATPVERAVAIVLALKRGNDIRREKVDGNIDNPKLIESLLGNTTHISIIDADSNTAAITTSNGQGAGFILGDTGIMPNNFLGEPDLNPAGFFSHPAGTVLPSMMAPTFLKQNGQIVAALGSAGSERIRSAIVQVVVNLADGMTPQEAVDHPRVHWDGKTVQMEPFKSEITDSLKTQTDLPINLWHEQNLYFGGLQLATPQGGAGDPRRGGAVA